MLADAIIWLLPGRFEFPFRDPDLYRLGRPMIGDYCRWRPPAS